MDKMKMESSNLADEKFEQLKSLFPNVVTETIVEGVLHRAIDKDKLMQEINAYVLEGLDERYNFTWPDKRKSVVLANEPTRKTLRPCRQESVNFDETENLYIEGDNLEVLKLLRHTYMGKIKMIYIDPPYNTGKDFLYKDNFYIDKEEYDENSGQYDEDGNLLFSNTESNGRYHTDWLNMMYPRLRMARDLLTDDGAIFISIDEHEVSNLKKICDEIFGENNYIECFIWVKNSTKNLSKTTSTNHEYILCYSKMKTYIEEQLLFRIEKPGINEVQAILKEANDSSLSVEETEKRLKQFYKSREDLKGINSYGKVDYVINSDGKKEMKLYTLSDLSAPKSVGKALDYDVYHPVTKKPCKVPSRGWVCSETKMLEYINNNLVYFYEDETKVPRFKRYLDTVQTEVMKSVIENFNDGKKDLMKLFNGEAFFENSKPVSLLSYLFLLTDKDTIILDFFSGSATTAHAVMELNAEDGGNRKFIMVQLPEETDEKSEAYKAGYKNICEIGKERIRRAGAKIKEENPESSIDTGFKVFKLDSSNMEDVYYKAEELTQIDISKTINNLKEDRTEEDLLYSIMLEIGVLLTSKIVKDKYNDSEIYFVNGNYIIACFDRNIKEDTITYIAEQQPVNIVLNQHVSDSLLTNIEQIFKKISAYTIIRMI